MGSGFVAPNQVLPAPDGRTLVVEQDGRIRALADKAVFLDVRDKVRFQGERGLLGATFTADGSRLFVHYSRAGDGATVVAEYAVSGGRATGGTVLLTIAQPFANHNGGSVLVGPDGHLHLALGDGGSANDPGNRAQDTDDPLGSILRLDVSTPGTAQPAAGNPGFGDPRIWHVGLRNPFRMAFDSNLLYIADVGQGAWEEVNVVAAGQGGRNFGWRRYEGSHCILGPCGTSGLTMPVLEYSTHSDGSCAIIGGEVYRGSAIPGLTGHYLYSDVCGGWLRSFRFSNGAATDQRDWTAQVGRIREGSGNYQGISGFGHDANGEMYVCGISGTIHRIVPG